MDAPNAWEELKPEDLPSEDLQWLAHTHGMEAALGMWRRCKGTKVNFPRQFPAAFIRRYLERYWDGANTRSVARALHISERTVQVYLQQTAGRRRAKRDEVQLSFLA
jgi:hypothetical protein